MLRDEEKIFFIRTALNARSLSECRIKEGAVLIRGNQMISYGHNRYIISDEEYEISAIYDAIFGSRHENLIGTGIVSTYFPLFDDLKLIIAIGVNTLYFMGKIENTDSVKFLNTLTKKLIPFEIIQLQEN